MKLAQEGAAVTEKCERCGRSGELMPSSVRVGGRELMVCPPCYTEIKLEDGHGRTEALPERRRAGLR
jgi:ribosome-binding protein aMBF1 (putative translation factor)